MQHEAGNLSFIVREKFDSCVYYLQEEYCLGLRKKRKLWLIRALGHQLAVFQRNDEIRVTCRFVKNCTLRKGRGRCKGVPEWSQLPISQAAVATPMVVARQVDVFPFQW